jgi:hypothetical protein
MANTSSKAKPLQTFAISYGFMGGKRHAKKLNKRLLAAGFEPANIDHADMIIAHSAGCWLIPEGVAPRLVLYIGMPLAQAKPREAWLEANLKSFHNGLLPGLHVKMIDTYYGLRQPLRNLRIVRSAKIAQPVIITNAQAVFIAHRYDPWTRSDSLQNYIDSQDWAFIDLPGSHGTIWEKPELFVEVIKYYARLLA